MKHQQLILGNKMKKETETVKKPGSRRAKQIKPMDKPLTETKVEVKELTMDKKPTRRSGKKTKVNTEIPVDTTMYVGGMDNKVKSTKTNDVTIKDIPVESTIVIMQPKESKPNWWKSFTNRFKRNK